MKISGLLLSLIIAFGATSVQAESVYKWTDDEGVTHFGDRQPTGKTSETVDVRSGTSRSSDQASPQEQVQAMDEAREEQAEKDKLTRQEEAIAKQRQKNCEIAKANLNTLNSHARIKVREGGEERFLTPEEIQTKRAEFEKIANEDCQD
ncbi:DUF4124 domain-containing protein [Marinobacter sp. JSM 1782161]|uniref:DUF4124 domain-containing protein n=1 Tax=Marinobacter sp. JSM 1782161 TaxID=2685906 RepID=UPI00140328F5|nr:DUF4124 domain-containing protein [Marinobacter sp. JSM 1782161]